MSMNFKHRNFQAYCRGFTLLEVMLAAAVIAGAMVITLASLGSSAKASAAANCRCTGSDIAGDILNKLQAGLVEPGESGSQMEDSVEYVWQLEQLANHAHGRHIKCTVSWINAGRSDSVSVELAIKP